MSIRKSIVYVDHHPHCAARIRMAIHLAKSFAAELYGLYVNDWAQRVMMITPEIVPTLTETQHSLWQQQETHARESFERISNEEEFKTHWISCEGDLITTLCHHTYTADLIILNRADDVKSHAHQQADITHGVILGAACPVMILPPEPSFPLGKHIMIAWDMSREAALAVKAAIPFLSSAQTIEILTLTPHTLPFAEEQNHHQLLLAFLQQHGIHAESRIHDRQKLSVAEALLFHATAREIDMIVMGAYGHSRLREIILGGSSKDMLKTTSLPLLVYH